MGAPLQPALGGLLQRAVRALGLGLALLACSAAQGAPEDADTRLLDELIGAQVAPGKVPGAAAVLVRRDGHVSLRAWGSARLDGAVPVVAEDTVFRVGSITKAFTAVAVLQLVDEGKVDLQADANRYLKGVQIPAGATPVRVLDLLTHRSGFDGELTHVGLDDAAAAAQSPDQRLQRDIRRLRPAGELAVYDNMAWGLLGHLVESVDGVPYAQAIARRIFQPLGMHHSQIGLPASGAVASAYEVGSNGAPQWRPQIHLRRGWQGAGDASTTAADMARWLQMLLAGGQGPAGPLLKPETFKRLTDTTQFSLHPGVPGTGLGVYGLGRAGSGAFGHGGTIRGFNAIFMVMPAQDVAVFAVMNLNKAAPEMSARGLVDYLANPPGPSAIDPTDYLIIDLPELLAGRLQPAEAAAVAAADTTDATDWSGRYAGLRAQSYEGLLPRLAAAVFIPARSVSRQPDGTLQVGPRGPYRVAGKGLVRLDKPAGPLLTQLGFAQVGGRSVMGPHTLQPSGRLAWYEHTAATVPALLLTPLLLLLLPLLHLARWRQAWRFDLAVAALAAVVVLALGLELVLASEVQREWGQGWVASVWRAMLNVALWGLFALTARALWRAWRPGSAAATAQTAGVGRTHATVLAVLAAALLLAAAYWQVLGRL